MLATKFAGKQYEINVLIPPAPGNNIHIFSHSLHILLFIIWKTHISFQDHNTLFHFENTHTDTTLLSLHFASNRVV